MTFGEWAVGGPRFTHSVTFSHFTQLLVSEVINLHQYACIERNIQISNESYFAKDIIKNFIFLVFYALVRS